MALVELDGSIESNTGGSVEEPLVPLENSPAKRVEGIIEGRFNAEFTNSCWAPKYHTAARKVELLTPVGDTAQ